MSIIESMKAFASDEKVQMFALGALSGAVVAGTITYFCASKSETVIADSVKAAEPEAPKAEPTVEPKADDNVDPNNPKGEAVE